MKYDLGSVQGPVGERGPAGPQGPAGTINTEFHSLSLENGWIEMDRYANGISKQGKHIIVNFSIKNGKRDNDTTILTLPVGFRPNYHIEGPVLQEDNTNAKYFVYRDTGRIAINNVNSNSIKGCISFYLK